MAASEYTRELREKCVCFQNQIYDMEEFLNDYGMIWVGDQIHDDEEKTNKQEKVVQAEEGSWKPGD